MQEYREPLFHRGRVLKQESLEALRDFPGGLARLGLSDWGDGILYGFDISYDKPADKSMGQGTENAMDGKIVVGPGAVWHRGHIVLTEKEVFDFRAYDQPVAVCLKFYPDSYTEDFYVHPLELRIKSGTAGESELELGRFRLSRGARLRKDYQDLRDYRTAYNTLDITQAPYAGPGGVTVSPVLLRGFARAVLENAAAGDLDVGFALLCLNQPPVSRECLLRYVSRRLGGPFRELSHSEIYERLVRIAGFCSRGAGQGHKKEGPAVI